jgi:hypothetical protein
VPTVVRSTPQPVPTVPAHKAAGRHVKTTAKTGAVATTVMPVDAALPSSAAPSSTAPATAETQQGYDSTRLPEQPSNTAAAAPTPTMASQPAPADPPPAAAPAEEPPAAPVDETQRGALPAVPAQPADSTPPASSSSPSDTTPAGPAAP